VIEYYVLKNSYREMDEGEEGEGGEGGEKGASYSG